MPWTERPPLDIAAFLLLSEDGGNLLLPNGRLLIKSGFDWDDRAVPASNWTERPTVTSNWTEREGL